MVDGNHSMEKLDNILRERGFRGRTPAENAFFLDFIEKQHKVTVARSRLLMAKFDLARAQEALDANTGQPPALRPIPTREEVDAAAAADIAASKELMGFVAEATRRIIHPHGLKSDDEIIAVKMLGEILLDKAKELGISDAPFAGWEVMAGAAIQFLATFPTEV